MPYLRFTRDKRGYENTFVVHTKRKRGRSRSRILYWFRTPPGVRVGRSALDEDAIRLIEEHNPDVEFDWTRILKGQATEALPAPVREGADRQAHRRKGPAAPRPPGAHTEALAGSVERTGTAADDRELAGARGDLEEIEAEITATDDSALLERNADDVISPEPLASDGGAADLMQDVIGRDDMATIDTPVRVEPAVTAAHARLGSEGVLRLRARYAEVLARISERTTDPVRVEELKTRAERLNPDTWVTEEEVRQGLEEYEAVFETLRAVVGRRRRRRRREAGPAADRSAERVTSAASPSGMAPGAEQQEEADSEIEDL